MSETDIRGATVYLCVGPFAGFGFRREVVRERLYIWRLILGWVSLSVATFDAEQFIHMAARALTSADQRMEAARVSAEAFSPTHRDEGRDG